MAVTATDLFRAACALAQASEGQGDTPKGAQGFEIALRYLHRCYEADGCDYAKNARCQLRHSLRVQVYSSDCVLLLPAQGMCSDFLQTQIYCVMLVLVRLACFLCRWS